MFLWTLGKRIVGMTFMVGGLFLFGMKGFLVGVIIYNWFCYFVNIGLVSKHIGYKWSRQLLDLTPVTIASLLSAVVAFLVARPFHLGLYSDGIVKLVVCLGIYMVWSLIFKPEAYTYTLTIIPSKFRLWEKRKKKNSKIRK